MKRFMKKAFSPWKLVMTILLLAFAILAYTGTALAQSKKEYPYLIKVNRIHNTITVYTRDETGIYSKPVKAIVCSVGEKGTETVLGTYQTKAKYRWKSLMGGVWGQYSTRIVGGILFHSVYYMKYKDPASLAVKEYNKLGDAASHGCIRLTVEDAKWIYDHCPVETTVVIYDDKNSPGPLGKPEAIKLPATALWDPTDPSSKNPFKNKKPNIYGVQNLKVSWGQEINLREGITAKSTVGTDITDHLAVNGAINIYKAGDYTITYTATDVLGRSCKKSATVTVEECPSLPVFEGIHDRVVQSAAEITDEAVLSGIQVHSDLLQLDSNSIEARIEKISDTEYTVIYILRLGEEEAVTGQAVYLVDQEAPELLGISDRILVPGQIPDKDFCLSGISVTDNHTTMTMENITVTIVEMSGFPGDALPEQNLYYLITYEASDEAGNTAVLTAVFHY